MDVTDRILEAAGQAPVVPDDPDDEESILDAVGTAIGNFVDWISGGSSGDSTTTSGVTSFSNLGFPITWKTTTSGKSGGSDTGNNIGFDNSNDFHVKMADSDSKFFIRNSGGQLFEITNSITKLYKSAYPHQNKTLSLGADGQTWAGVHSQTLDAYAALRLHSSPITDSAADNGRIWLDGSTVKIKSGGVVKDIDDIGGVAPISASWRSLTNDMIPATSGDYNIGSPSLKWDNLYLTGDIYADDIEVDHATADDLRTRIFNASGSSNMQTISATDVHLTKGISFYKSLAHNGDKIGFFGKTPATKYTTPLSKVTNSAQNGADLGDVGSVAGSVVAVAHTVDQLVDIVKRYGLAA